MTDRGTLVVVSGFSGVGKGTIVKRLMEKYDHYALSISATTRPPRVGEMEGREYFFRTKEEFLDMIGRGELLEYASYCDNYYGTPRAYVQKQLENGLDVILEIEIQGALKIKKAYPEALLLFIMPPDSEALRTRLVGRGTETTEVIESRLKRAGEEAEGIEAYDYMLVNDDLETCVEEAHALIALQRHRIDRNARFIEKIRREVKEFSKGDH